MLDVLSVSLKIMCILVLSSEGHYRIVLGSWPNLIKFIE